MTRGNLSRLSTVIARLPKEVVAISPALTLSLRDFRRKSWQSLPVAVAAPNHPKKSCPFRNVIARAALPPVAISHGGREALTIRQLSFFSPRDCRGVPARSHHPTPRNDTTPTVIAKPALAGCGNLSRRLWRHKPFEKSCPLWPRDCHGAPAPPHHPTPRNDRGGNAIATASPPLHTTPRLAMTH